MDRRTLDVAVPILYAIAVLIAVTVGSGSVRWLVPAVGGMLVGLYYAALRQNLPASKSSEGDRR